MFNKNEQAYINDIVIALEAAQVMADRLGEETCVLKDFRVVVLRLNGEPVLEIVRPRVYKKSAYDRYYA